ncbi:MAG: homoserine kinase [Pseudomonadota bacterium]
MIAQRVRAFAPASIGNLGVGFDVLGLAISGAGDWVTAERSDEAGVVITSISGDEIGADATQLSTQTQSNTAGIAAQALWAECGGTAGLRLALRKGTPLGSGMGSSAASAVAGAMAANALLPEPLPAHELLEYAMLGEAFASKARHADNVAPSLLGGLVLCPVGRLPKVTVLPVPDGVRSVIVHPHLRVNTSAARAVLGDSLPVGLAVQQTGLLANFIHACHTGDIALLGESLADVIIEPQRASLVSGFTEVKAAAQRSGALGCSLSGSGPSVFSLARSADAQQVASAMQSAFAAHGIQSDAWVSSMHAPGATIEVLA